MQTDNSAWGLLRLAPTIKFQSLTLGDVALARRLSSAESLDDPRMVRRRAISSVTDHGKKNTFYVYISPHPWDT